MSSGVWVVVTYDSKLYPGKVCNKDANGITVPCQKDEIYYTFENVHKKIDPPFPLNSRGKWGFKDPIHLLVRSNPPDTIMLNFDVFLSLKCDFRDLIYLLSYVLQTLTSMRLFIP